MKKILNIPTDIQLTKISELIANELSDIKKNSMTIIFELDKDLLRQVDENYFYKLNPNAMSSDFEPVSEINLNIDGIKFKFIEKIHDDE